MSRKQVSVEPMKVIGMHRRAALREVTFALLAAIVFATPEPAEAADRIVLRNLKIISDRTVVGFDEDGVRLDDSSMLRWDEIEKANVAGGQQAAFDTMLADLGGHLYRLRQRLSVGDYAGLLPHAEATHSRYAGRRSETAYMVLQALMWSRLATGRREQALEPYLRCYEYLRSRGTAEVSLPGERRLRFDPMTGISPELAPVWFDPEAAKAAMPSVFQAVAAMQHPRPDGAYIYYATLALAAGDDDAAKRILAAVKSQHPPILQLLDILAAQREVQAGRLGEAASSLEARLDQLAPANKPLALYWLGVGKANSGDALTQRLGLLHLLRIPAVYGRDHPELAGAALFESMQTLAKQNDARGSVSVRAELLDRYGQTFFAARIKSEGSSKRDSKEAP